MSSIFLAYVRGDDYPFDPVDPFPNQSGCEQTEAGAQGVVDLLVNCGSRVGLAAGLAAGNLQRGEMELLALKRYG